MRLNRVIFLPLLLAGCAAQADQTANSDQDSRLEELENRVAELESRADTTEADTKAVAAAAAVGLKQPVTAPTDLGTDRAVERIKKLEAAERDRGVKEADAAFKDAVKQ